MDRKLVLVISVIGMLLASVPARAIAQPTPTIWTDQYDYSPGSLVTIHGANFTIAQVIVDVTDPDGQVQSWTVSVTNGGFATTYQLGSVPGVYLATATDPATSAVLAQTEFDPLPTPPTTYGSTSISSSFTSSTPTRDGRLAPFSASYTDGGSTPWPFTAANEWSNAAKFGMFSSATEPPWTTTKNLMFFPPTGWATLTIPPSGSPTPTSPPWAPSWLFIMNDATHLYLLGEINAVGDKACFECPGGSGPSDFMSFNFDTNHNAQADKAYSWVFAYASPNLQGEVYAINCPQVASSTNGVAAGSCPSPTVYEVIIPLSDLGCTPGVSCSVGLYVDSHASPACGGKNTQPCVFTPPTSSSLLTTPNPSISVAVGTSISDTAALTLSSGSGTPSGTVSWFLYAGTCSGITGSALYSATATVGSSNNGATVNYASGSFSTGALSAGNYVWLVRYSGGGGWPATPTTGVSLGGNFYDCEPIVLTTSHGVPEFPVGLPLLLALALPALILLRRRLPQP